MGNARNRWLSNFNRVFRDNHIGSRCSGFHINIDNHHAIFKLRSTCNDCAVTINNNAVAIKDQIILAACHIHIGKRCFSFASALGNQGKAHIIFSSLIGRTIGNNDESWCALCQLCSNSTINPEVFTDCDTDINAVDANDKRGISCHEIAVLIEDSVIR